MRSNTLISIVVIISAAMIAGIILVQSKSYQPDELQLRPRAVSEDSASYLRTQFITCFQKKEARWRSSCYKELAKIVMKQFSLSDALSALAKIQYERTPDIAGQCHSVVHYFAQNEYKTTKNAAEAFQQCQIVCGEGCYHGVVEAYLEEKNLGGADDARLEQAVSEICDTVKNDPRKIIYEHCVHGIGHAFMLMTQNGLPQSLAMCTRFFGENADKHYQCLGGALMENAFSAGNPDHPTRFADPADLTYPCTILDEKYRAICYGAQSAVALGRGNWKGASSFCTGIPQEYQDACFASLGANAVVAFIDNLKSLKATCDLAPSGELRSQCIQGSVKFLGYGKAGDISQFSNYCRVVDDEYRKICFEMLGDVASSWFPKELRGEKCKNASETNQEYDWCMTEIQ